MDRIKRWLLGEAKPVDADLADGHDSSDTIEIEAVEIPIDTAIDLHAFAPRDVREVVEAYLEAAVEAGYDEVRIIHGRGKGVQRRSVQSLLSKHPAVLDFHDAGAARGGWGATIVRLARPADPDGG